MTMPPPEPESMQQMAISNSESRLLKTLRLLRDLEPTTAGQVEEFVWSLVEVHMKWDLNDPVSIKRATELAGLDPQLKRESDAINAEFACAEEDGLEPY